MSGAIVDTRSGKVQGMFQSSGQGGPAIPGAAPPTPTPAPGVSNKPK